MAAFLETELSCKKARTFQHSVVPVTEAKIPTSKNLRLKIQSGFVETLTSASCPALVDFAIICQTKSNSQSILSYSIDYYKDDDRSSYKTSMTSSQCVCACMIITQFVRAWRYPSDDITQTKSQSLSQKWKVWTYSHSHFCSSNWEAVMQHDTYS